MKRNIVILALLLAAVVGVVVMNLDKDKNAADARDPSDIQDAVSQLAEAPKKGARAPSFSLASLDGTKTYDVGGPSDKVTIVNFWAAWCGPCEAEAPDLVGLYAKYKGDIELYAVNATNYDKLREAKVFVKEQGFTMPVLTDEKGTAGDLYKVFSYPTSFIVDRDGVVLERIEGVIERKQWEQYLDKAIRS
ncbi:TlpA family protein disulfide reductase [Cohnella panacarvi]|uniref:TlpA family protein disulfide reductase n=1 Tax=Cohnella panacarvi TaxID=400776 RepID=UPI000479027D|nr:TlpA disulfide reductase family protein [Cohnella panacarvi]